MRISSLVKFVSAAGLGASLAGCSGAATSSSVRPALASAAGIERAHGDLLAVSDSANNFVSISDFFGHLNAVLTNGLREPQGLAFDAEDRLFVANTADSQILIYPKPYSSVSLTLSDAGELPIGVAVAADGTVGVTNARSESGGAGSVSLYAKGATTPCATVKSRSFAQLYYDAFDRAGNLFVDATDAKGHFIAGEVKGGCQATSITTLSIDNTIGSPGGVAVLRNGNIALGEQAGLNVTSIVYTYAPPKGRSLGAPIVTTTLHGVYDGVTFAFKPFDHSLWVADAEAEDFAEFDYPSGTAITALANYGTPAGVAITQAQP